MAETRDLTITRVFDAPRERVWQAWTSPEHFMQWWGPKGFTSPVCQIDLRVGGKYLSSMKSADGQVLYGAGVYQEVVPLERLVYTDGFADAEGHPVPASHYGLPDDFPAQMQIVVTFEDAAGKTKMTLLHRGLPAGDMTEQTGVGWNQSFDKLGVSLT